MAAYYTELDCLHCGQITDHTVVYASNYIKRIECDRCAYVLERSALTLLWHYSHDLPDRGIALTRRLKSEVRTHPFTFALSLPRRVVHKPIEVVRELADLYLA